MSEISNEIVIERVNINLTQKRLVAILANTEPKEITITQSQLCQYEQGNIMPAADRYMKIKAALKSERDRLKSI